ncbi:MAG: Crp/Fnr family transcriptional regulator [Acinetobacter sp.]
MVNNSLNQIYEYKIRVLRSNFKTLSNDKINYILDHSFIRKYQKGDLILNKENCSEGVFILLDGIIQIGYLSPLGRFHAFNYFSEKSPINLLACINQQAIDYDYYAFNQVRILHIPASIFQKEISNNNDLKQDALDILSLRMQHLLQQVKFLQVANLHQKICKILLDLSDQYGAEHALGAEIRLRISQHDLADLLSASRQTINKEIKNLMALDVLYWQYENIIIKNHDYLKKQIYWI